MDPLIDETIAAESLAAEVVERLTELTRLLLIAGGRHRARGRAEGDDFSAMHTTADHLRREAERLRARLAPFASEARQMDCVTA